MPAKVENIEDPQIARIECAGGCPPSHKMARRVSTIVVVTLLTLLAGSLIYLLISGGSQ